MMTWQNTLLPLVDFDNASDEDIARGIKSWRNRELTDSDWTQLPDSPLANKAAWAAYRQELRDIPEQGPDPKLWIFPTKP